MHFEWDPEKNVENIEKHGVSFDEAKLAWLDSHRVSDRDTRHSDEELRFYLYGKVDSDVLTVRYTRRGDLIRIRGAGYWREGRERYEQRNTWRR